MNYGSDCDTDSLGDVSELFLYEPTPRSDKAVSKKEYSSIHPFNELPRKGTSIMHHDGSYSINGSSKYNYIVDMEKAEAKKREVYISTTVRPALKVP